MDYYKEIKNILIDNEIYSRVKDYSKERHTLVTHYEVGKLLLEAGSKYGEDIIGNYSNKLSIEVDKKYNPRTLRRMRQLYQFFEKQKWSPAGTKLSISHIRQLFILTDSNEINYYADQILKRNLSKRQLEIIIKSNEYKRLSDETKLKLATNEDITLIDNIKNPIMISNKYDTTDISEKMLKGLILNDIISFMKELGEGFSFIDSEYKIKLGDTYNYIDLLLFNYKYNCFVVIELKVTELKKEHIGQIQIYMNYIDNNLKTINQDKTIGIIICKKDNKYIIEYCSDNRIISRTYLLI